jgi:hypothetical protein
VYNTEGKNDWQPISVRTFDFNGISNIYPQIEIDSCGYASQQSGLIWTSAAATITGLVGTTGLYAGQLVNGTGITAGTTIATVDSPTQITLSQNPASGTGGTLTFGLIQAIGFGTWEVGVAGTNGTLDPQVVSRRKLVMREPYRTTVTNSTVDLNGLVCGGAVLAPNVNGGAPMVVYQSGPGDGIPVSIVAVAANAAGTVWTPTTLMSWADQPTGAHAACGQYPAIELTCSNAGGSVSLITNTDGSRSLTISDSSPQTHTITIPFVAGPAYGQPTITSVASTISGYSGWIATPAGSGSVAADPYVTDGSTGTAIISWMYDQTVSVTSTPAYLLLTPPPNNVSWAWNPKSGTGVMICVRYHTLTSDGNWTTSMHTRTYTPGSGWGNEVMIPQSFWTANFVNGDLAKEVAAPISGFCDAAGNLVFGLYTETTNGEHL